MLHCTFIGIKILFYQFNNINHFRETQNTQYFLDLQNNYTTEQYRTHGIICVHA